MIKIEIICKAAKLAPVAALAAEVCFLLLISNWNSVTSVKIERYV